MIGGGQGAGGAGGALSAIAGQGSTDGGDMTLTAGIGVAATGGDVVGAGHYRKCPIGNRDVGRTGEGGNRL